MDAYEKSLVAVAKAEDTYDLLNHIAWTDVIKPSLEREMFSLSKLLVEEALGTPIPGGRTREQIAGMCYGIRHIITLFEQVLQRGKIAIEDLHKSGIRLE